MPLTAAVLVASVFAASGPVAAYPDNPTKTTGQNFSNCSYNSGNNSLDILIRNLQASYVNANTNGPETAYDLYTGQIASVNACCAQQGGGDNSACGCNGYLTASPTGSSYTCK